MARTGAGTRRSARTSQAKSVFSPPGSALKQRAKKKPKVGDGEDAAEAERIAREAEAEEAVRLQAVKDKKANEAKETDPVTEKKDVGQEEENTGGAVPTAVQKDKDDDDAIAEDAGGSLYSDAIAAAIKRGGDQDKTEKSPFEVLLVRVRAGYDVRGSSHRTAAGQYLAWLLSVALCTSLSECFSAK
jgi:hypothetical protein